MDPMLIVVIIFVVAFILVKRASLTSAADVVESMKSEYVIVDVRTPSEYNSSHVDKAVNIPLSMISSAVDQLPEDKGQAILLYCLSGARSGSAVSILKKKGYTRVQNLGSISRAKSLIAQGLEN